MIILSSFRARLDAAERDLAIEALAAEHGSITRAARLVGLHRFQLRRIVVRHGLQHLLHQASRATFSEHGNAAWRALADV